MSHQVRTHTRTVKGKTVTVRQHKAADPEAAQRKRDAFERRVLTERQRAAHPTAYATPRRAPGERRTRKKTGWTRAKSHARKARRLWRRHKARAVATGSWPWAGRAATRPAAAPQGTQGMAAMAQEEDT